ncbi:2883_t:CDS:2 [Paraglomus occultum]|uniref:2883_t:CDS:1 n=1 Tax=Paraglomus occultum TaxID=144539 RepID=A0A9N9FY55_9GLOM|nr:2883_t:CDS:2 [Paraglomus occultum]
MYKQIFITLLLLASLFSANAIPARNALGNIAKRNGNESDNDDNKIIGKSEFRTGSNGFEATFTLVQLPSADGDNDSDDHQVFVTSLIVLDQSLRVEVRECGSNDGDNDSDDVNGEVLFDLTPFVKSGTEWSTVLNNADVNKLFGKCVVISNGDKRGLPTQSIIRHAP